MKVHVRPHATFRKDGANLLMDLPVKLTDALKGIGGMLGRGQGGFDGGAASGGGADDVAGGDFERIIGSPFAEISDDDIDNLFSE